MARTEEHVVTPADIQAIMSGRDRADLRVSPGTPGAMRLVDVTPGSVAERLGGRDGDIIESINGVPLSNVAKGYEAAYAAIAARQIVIAGQRDGEPFTITVKIQG